VDTVNMLTLLACMNVCSIHVLYRPADISTPKVC